jgi:hypothetical protein
VAVAARPQGVHQLELRLPLGALGARGHQALVELGQLLIVDIEAERVEDAMIDPVGLDRALGLLRPRAQLDQPLAEPARGAVGGLELAGALGVDRALGDGVGDARRLDRVARGETRWR